MRRIPRYRHQFRPNLSNRIYSKIAEEYTVTGTTDTISTKSIIAATIEGSLSVTTDCMEAAVVRFHGTFVEI